MAFRRITAEELQSLREQERPPPDPQQVPTQSSAKFKRVTEDEYLRMQGVQDEVSPGPPPNEPPGLVGRMVQRAFGTDVDDPLELERMGTVASGAIGGALVGARTPIAPGAAGILINPITGAAAGGLLGAVGGAVAPEATLELGEFLGVFPKGTRDTRGLSEDELKRVVAGEALLEVATTGAATGFRAAGRFVGRKATGIGKTEESLARQASSMGIELAPFQLGERGLGRGIINVMGRMPYIGGSARKVIESADEATRMVVEGAPERIAPLMASSVVGRAIWKDSKAAVKAFSKKFEARYDELKLAAKQAGVKAKMVNTSEVAEAIYGSLNELRGARIGPDGKKAITTASPASEAAMELVNSFRGMDDLTYAQADESLSKIQQFIRGSDESVRGQISKALSPLSGAIKTDISKNSYGDGASEIVDALARLDTEYNETLSEVFETVAANRLATVQRGGVRSRVTPSKRRTRVPADKLAQTVVDLDSPQVMDELSRLITPDTYKAVASHSLNNVLERSLREKDGLLKIDADRMGRELGVTGTGGRTEGMAKMLEKADSPLSMEDLRTFHSIVDKIADAPVPNWSIYVARRAMLGGARSALRALFPFIGATSAGAAAGGGAGAAIVGLAMFAGAKGLTAAVSNPVNARALREVLRPESSNIIRRAAYLRLMRLGVEGLEQAGEIGTDAVKSVLQEAVNYAEEIFPDGDESGDSK